MAAGRFSHRNESAAQLAYRRFGSQMVREFNQIKLVLKQHSPGRLLAHNYAFTEFDHREVAQDLDVASWDSYPLGFTDLFIPSDEQRQRYMRTGHPDIAAFSRPVSVCGSPLGDGAAAGAG